jgi:hypothetical protein
MTPHDDPDLMLRYTVLSLVVGTIILLAIMLAVIL